MLLKVGCEIFFGDGSLKNATFIKVIFRKMQENSKATA
jgi:hypothetical protein